MANHSIWLAKLVASNGGKPTGASACAVGAVVVASAAGAELVMRLDDASCTTVPFCATSAAADEVAWATRTTESAIDGHLASPQPRRSPEAAIRLVRSQTA